MTEFTDFEVFLQQLVTGVANGSIIALIALGYTMVYGIVELINFAHGDLFMLGCFFALSIVGVSGIHADSSPAAIVLLLALLLLLVPLFCGLVNVAVDRFAYRPLRQAPRLAPLVSAIGVSFIFLNIGLFWGGLPLEVFGDGRAAAAPKDFPALIASDNLLGATSNVWISPRDVFVVAVTIPLLLVLSVVVKYTKLGKAMRAVAQDPGAAQLMGIDIDRVVGITFMIGGGLAGIAAVVYSLFNNTIFFQMGYRVGMDAFTAAVLGGIGNLPGACLGGLCIGIIRALSDQYIATQWTNVVVFGVLIGVLVFRPAGLLGASVREKV